jgi:hypothetical protein
LKFRLITFSAIRAQLRADIRDTLTVSTNLAQLIFFLGL